ncbi:hypothetical protein [Halorubrum saccharovorum]|uniref:hypothetical protein n=1 Tax=Halorubrum saccharovorum TaxID=2248 RepID=UPI000A8FA96C|nr:hypothetical protein [Halorubrum saccharovorum]
MVVRPGLGGHRGASLDRCRNRGLAVDDGVFAEEVHLPRRFTEGHLLQMGNPDVHGGEERDTVRIYATLGC